MNDFNKPSHHELPSIDLVIDHQIIEYQGYLPDDALIYDWISTALNDKYKNPALALVLIEATAMAEYNENYRKQSKPTNVLSFPADMPSDTNPMLLGDILVCPEIINQEAATQDIDFTAHWAHIIVHGTLHLLGYDHILDHDARQMEAEEIRILQQLGVNNPYER